jgi:hypothetical protein
MGNQHDVIYKRLFYRAEVAKLKGKLEKITINSAMNFSLDCEVLKYIIIS